MKCICAEQPSSFDANKPRGTSPATLVEIAHDATGWRRLWRCSECGQLWQIDHPDKLQPRFALKLPATSDFPADTRAAQLDEISREFGPEVAEKCAWIGCARPRLARIAFCAEHVLERRGKTPKP